MSYRFALPKETKTFFHFRNEYKQYIVILHCSCFFWGSFFFSIFVGCWYDQWGFTRPIIALNDWVNLGVVDVFWASPWSFAVPPFGDMQFWPAHKLQSNNKQTWTPVLSMLYPRCCKSILCILHIQNTYNTHMYLCIITYVYLYIYLYIYR
jgi:hypothetical protein